MRRVLLSQNKLCGLFCLQLNASHPLSEGYLLCHHVICACIPEKILCVAPVNVRNSFFNHLADNLYGQVELVRLYPDRYFSVVVEVLVAHDPELEYALNELVVLLHHNEHILPVVLLLALDVVLRLRPEFVIVLNLIDFKPKLLAYCHTELHPACVSFQLHLARDLTIHLEHKGILLSDGWFEHAGLSSAGSSRGTSGATSTRKFLLKGD